ncbi:MAG: rod shape-determining protein MreC [Treponema sp.]|nr:rod shape-determining protein MreC [Treponema sp.]
MAGGGKTQKGRGLELYIFIALALVSFFTLFFSSRAAFVEFRTLGVSVFSGLRGIIDEVSSGLSRTVLSIQELRSLRREHAELLERLSRYQQLERTSAEIIQENIRLRQQLGFSQNMPHRHIPARLIGRDPNNLFSAFVINKGTHAGVAVDMPVIAFHGGTQGLVGRIISSGPFESLVMPLYDARGFVASRLTQSRHEGLVQGRGNPQAPLVMRYITSRALGDLSIGDMVVTSGMGGVYPSGINIGRIVKIHAQETDLSMEVDLQPVVDFFRLEYVFVIRAIVDTNDSIDSDSDATDGIIIEESGRAAGRGIND